MWHFTNIMALWCLVIIFHKKYLIVVSMVGFSLHAPSQLQVDSLGGLMIYFINT